MFSTYEIRILREGTSTPQLHVSRHVSDHAAVRRAHRLCRAGDQVEVWRGNVCVYSSFRAAA